MPESNSHQHDLSSADQRRQRWIGIFARTPLDQLEQHGANLIAQHQFLILRAPERGLVMVRARAGGNGALFNAGEMTVTRCSVRSPSGTTGHGYVAGRNQKHAELAAKLDAVMQEISPRQADALIDNLDEALSKAAIQRQQKSAPTRVDFYTLVRGDVE
tara:strand:- start:16946 stop:17422 length:477 start_codon:yes stop_codon:yes gene_type:complete